MRLETSFRRVAFSWSLLILYAGNIFLLSSISIQQTPIRFTHADKLIHAIEFGIFSLLFYFALRSSFHKAPILTLAVIALSASILYGALLEYHQSFNPFREAEALDVLANTVGAALAQGMILLRAYRLS